MKFHSHLSLYIRVSLALVFLCIQYSSQAQSTKPDLNKLQKKTNKLYYDLNKHIKEHNSEVHSQQYKNDSIFEELEIVRSDLINLNREINKIDRNINVLREIDREQNNDSMLNFSILYVLLAILYLIGIAALILGRRKLLLQNKSLKKEVDLISGKTEESLLALKGDLLVKLETEVEKLSKTEEKDKKEIRKKLTEARESIESRLREINNQLDDKFK